MRYNITQDFLEKLHLYTKDIPKLEYVRLSIPTRHNITLAKLNKYFGNIATPDIDNDSIQVKRYTYKNIKLELNFINKYDNVKDNLVAVFAKFKGTPTYRLLETTRRNNNFAVGSHFLPFTKLGFNAARCLLNGADYYELNKSQFSTSYQTTIRSWFWKATPETKSLHEVVVENARVNELYAIDVYEAIYNATKSVFNSVAKKATEYKVFNTIGYFDKQFAEHYGNTSYATRQLQNTMYVNDNFSVQANIFNMNAYYLNFANDENNFVSDSSSYLHWQHIEGALRDQFDSLNYAFDAFLDIAYTLPLSITINPAEVITKPTVDDEYFSKAIPDINLFYILNNRYISLPSLMTPSKADDFKAVLQMQHDEGLTQENILLNYDIITHHYFPTVFTTGSLKPVSGANEHMFARMLVYSKFKNPHRIKVSAWVYNRYVKDIVVTGSDCSMCSSSYVSIDITKLPADLVYGDLDGVFNSTDLIEMTTEETFNNHPICKSCIHDYKHQMTTYNGYWNKYGAFIGPDSIQEHSHNRANLEINDYDYRPEMNFVLTSNDDEHTLKLGVEIEVDDPDYRESGYYDDDDDWVEDDESSTSISTYKAASMFISTLTKGQNYAYAMRDGSLNNGFEIATMPATLNAHLDPAYFDYETAFNKTIRAGYRAHDTRTCGIHVHVDRSFFGASNKTQLYRAALMAYVIERNWQDVSRFSRRNIHSLEQWANKKDLNFYVNSSDDDDLVARKFVTEYDGDKYVMLNLQHRHSFEIRIFRSTLNLMTYKAILQFVDNLARLAMTLDITSAQRVSFKDIINYNPHPELVAYVNQRFGENYLGE